MNDKDEVEKEVAKILEPVGLRPPVPLRPATPATAPETPAQPVPTQAIGAEPEPLPSMLGRNFGKLYDLLEFVSVTIGERLTKHEQELDKRLAEIERVLGVQKQ